MSWISKKDLAGLAKLWIAFEIVVAILIVENLGLSGLAREYCDRFPTDACEEIDWEYYGY